MVKARERERKERIRRGQVARAVARALDGGGSGSGSGSSEIIEVIEERSTCSGGIAEDPMPVAGAAGDSVRRNSQAGKKAPQTSTPASSPAAGTRAGSAAAEKKRRRVEQEMASSGDSDGASTGSALAELKQMMTGLGVKMGMVKDDISEVRKDLGARIADSDRNV